MPVTLGRSPAGLTTVLRAERLCWWPLGPPSGDSSAGLARPGHECCSSEGTALSVSLSFTHTYTHARASAHTHACTHTHLHMYTHVHNTHAYTHTHMYTHTRVHMCIHTYTCTYIHTWKHINTHSHSLKAGEQGDKTEIPAPRPRPTPRPRHLGFTGSGSGHRPLPPSLRMCPVVSSQGFFSLALSGGTIFIPWWLRR